MAKRKATIYEIAKSQAALDENGGGCYRFHSGDCNKGACPIGEIYGCRDFEAYILGKITEATKNSPIKISDPMNYFMQLQKL